MKKLLLSLALLSLTNPVFAEFPVGKFGIRVSPDINVDDAAVSGDGDALGFRLEVGSSSIYGYGDHQMSNLDINRVDVDLDETRFGGGMRVSGDQGSVGASVEKYDFSIETATDSYSDDGIGVHINGEYYFPRGVGLFSSLGTLSLDENDGNELELGVRKRIEQTSEVFLSFRQLTLEDDNTSDELEIEGIRVGLNFVF